MRTRADFEKLIRDNLTGVTWNRLKQALLGSELISFGGVVNELIAGQYQTFLKNLSIEESEYIGLIVAGYNQRVVYDVVRPTIAQVQVPVTADVKPYDAVLTIGNNNYYNATYLRVGQTQITLYQGTLGSTALLGQMDEPFGTYQQSGVYTLNNHKYIKLPSSTLVDSLRVYVKYLNDDSLHPERVQYQAGDSQNIRVFRGYDNSLNVMVINSNVEDIQCKYVMGTTNVSSTSEADLKGVLSLGGQVSQVTVNETEGQASVEAARESFLQHSSMISAISTKNQIKQYVNTFPQVADCNPELITTGTVTVWIKPQYQAELDEIKEALNLYGEMAVYWQVSLGTPVNARVLLQAIDPNLTGDERSEIQTLVSDWINENIKFDTVLTPAWVLQSAIEYATRVSVSVAVTELVGNKLTIELASTPVTGTIRFIQDGQQVAWDARGRIRGYTLVYTIQDLSKLSFLGEQFIIPAGTSTYVTLENPQLTQLVSQNFDVATAERLFNNQQWLCVYYGNNRFKLYQNDIRFGSSDNSLVRDPDQSAIAQYPPATSGVGYISSQEETLIQDGAVYCLINTALARVSQEELTVTIAYFMLDASGTTYADTTDGTVREVSGIETGAKLSIANFNGVPLIIVLQSTGYTAYAYTERPSTGEMALIQVTLDDVEQSNFFEGCIELYGNGQMLVAVSEVDGKYTLKRAMFALNVSGDTYWLQIVSSIETANCDSKPTLITQDYNLQQVDGVNKLYKFAETEPLLSEGVSYPLLGEAGLVDYVNKTITLSTNVFADAEIQYSTQELQLTAANYYPVVQEVTWQ